MVYNVTLSLKFIYTADPVTHDMVKHTTDCLNWLWLSFTSKVSKVLYCLDLSRLYMDDLNCLLQRGEKMSRKEVQAIIDEVDENKDGKLDYKEVRMLSITMNYK